MKNIKFLPICIALVFTCQLSGAEQGDTISLPGSDKTYTEKQINDSFDVPDWYPDSHPAMPEVVQYGSKPRVFACASCHLTSGSGHPESGSLSGLPADYFTRQMKAYQHFQRDSITGVMIGIAKGMSDEQIREAANYFESLKPLNVQEVREVDEVPVTYINSRFMRLVDNSKNASEAIGERIITVPEDEFRVKARDPFATFITYVPRGYLAQGKNIVEQGKGSAAACVSCHGSDLKGTQIGPPIAGRHASYLVSQLRAYKAGVRRGEADPDGIMATNLKYFSEQEILATAAYIASLSRE
jgi:cytochrome c553